MTSTCSSNSASRVHLRLILRKRFKKDRHALAIHAGSACGSRRALAWFGLCAIGVRPGTAWRNEPAQAAASGKTGETSEDAYRRVPDHVPAGASKGAESHTPAAHAKA